MTALKKLKNENVQFDIVFLDPPFDTDFAEKSIEYISNNGLLNNDGMIVYEHVLNKKFILPENMELIDQRKYGTVMVSFIGRKNG